MSPAVTVLTAVRDGAAHLPATVESILGQTFRDLEYLIVDDASTDATPELLSAFAERDDRVRIVRRERSGGPFVAANEGLSSAQGDLVVRTDADDVSVPDRIERQVRYLEAHPRLVACGSHWRLLSADGAPYQSTRVIPDLPRILKWRLCVRGGPPHSTLCFRRSVLEDLGGYRELPVAQDFRLLCDLSRTDGLGIVQDVLVFYRRHATQLRARASDLQEQLGDDALGDHLSALLGSEAPPPAEVSRLRRLARSGASVSEARRSLHAWRRWWRADVALDASDRAALDHLVRDVWRDVLREAMRRSRLMGPIRVGRRVIDRLLRG